MSDNQSKQNSFFVLFVDGHFFEGHDKFGPLLAMADKMKKPPMIGKKRIPQISIREYHRDKFIGEPYFYNP